MTIRRILVVVLTLAWPLPAIAEPMPGQPQGYWAKDGKCEMPTGHLTVRGQTAILGKDASYELDWVPTGRSGGWSALRLRVDGIVSSIEYNVDDDTIYLRDPGWIMEPSLVIYRRCIQILPFAT